MNQAYPPTETSSSSHEPPSPWLCAAMAVDNIRRRLRSYIAQHAELAAEIQNARADLVVALKAMADAGSQEEA